MGATALPQPSSAPPPPADVALPAMKAAALLVLALAGRAGALELTKENWDKETAGKSVFVKFLAPW